MNEHDEAERMDTIVAPGINYLADSILSEEIASGRQLGQFRGGRGGEQLPVGDDDFWRLAGELASRVPEDLLRRYVQYLIYHCGWFEARIRAGHANPEIFAPRNASGAPDDEIAESEADPG